MPTDENGAVTAAVRKDERTERIRGETSVLQVVMNATTVLTNFFCRVQRPADGSMLQGMIN